MTFDKFIKRLKYHASQDVRRFKVINRYNEKQIRYQIGRACFCPLTYLALREKERYFRVGEYIEAAEVLGINHSDAHMIATSADNDFNPLVDEPLRKEIVTRMREEILKATECSSTNP